MYIAETFVAEYRESRSYSIFNSEGWWLNMWPLWGWIETLTKMAAWLFVFGIYAPNPAKSADVSTSTPISTSWISDPVFGVEVIVMWIACVLLAAAIADRLFLYREVISMVFVVPNNWAHWTVLFAMMKGREHINLTNMRCFFWLMLLGDISKLIFFKVHDFNIKALAKYILYLLVMLYTLAYAAILYLDYFGLSSPVTATKRWKQF